MPRTGGIGVEHVPTADDGRQGLRDHVLERAQVAREKHGPVIDAQSIMRVLEDRTIVRYPVSVRFDATGLQPGEFAYPQPMGEHPKHGYCLCIHPVFEASPDVWPLMIAYHIPPINYGDITEPEDCEAFGAALLGMDPEAYYAKLCELADSVGGTG